MVFKSLLLSISLALAAPDTSLFEMVYSAREANRKVTLVVNDPIQVQIEKGISMSQSPSSRTTYEIAFKNGALVDPAAVESESEVICIISVWRGLMQNIDSAKRTGTFDFQFQGTWHIFDVSKKKIPTAQLANKSARSEVELTLWPAKKDATIIEKSIYSIDVIVKSPPGQTPPPITGDTLKQCLGSTVQVFSFTPSK